MFLPVSEYSPRQPPSVLPPTPITPGIVAGGETQASEPRLPAEATGTTPWRIAKRIASTTPGTRLPQPKLKLMLITLAWWWTAKRMPWAIWSARPRPRRSRTRTGISFAR